ncbi:MAG: hypothetical protein Q4G43_04995 [Mobilicoccus sp.]|nr:hypothetical protein [Mobilicoccus sp.]
MSRVISVVGTAGGVGASTLATALAVRAAHHGASVVALDARPYGGGLDVPFGLDEQPGVRWRDLAECSGNIDGTELFRRLPLAARCGVVSFDRDPPLLPPREALEAVLGALGHLADLVVVDAPRAGEPWEEELADLSDEVIALTGTSVTALASAGASLAHLDLLHDGVWLACRTDRGQSDLPHTLTQVLGLPLLGALPTDSKVSAALADGRPPPARGAYTRAVDALLAGLRPVRRAA